MERDGEAALAAQLDYYRRRADEYDGTAYRDHAALMGVDALVDELQPRGTTLELACGTGIWTAPLARRVPELTALDGAPEMLALARSRVGNAPVHFVRAELFSWRPERRYDTVFFAFWLSHVPPERFVEFWSTVAEALQPEGRALFVDNGHEEARNERFATGGGTPMVERRLADGSRHQVVKVLHEPAELETSLAALGWEAKVRLVAPTVFSGSARRRV